MKAGFSWPNFRCVLPVTRKEGFSSSNEGSPARAYWPLQLAPRSAAAVGASTVGGYFDTRRGTDTRPQLPFVC